ncbi:cation transporter [candidate division WOR-1 bacterium DG_54_3]|uniref:Cation transporter n=1 Tax=candidate division WOR-1 bacterium DG_54_3 TaxID=1703775 RepID=A0A0S7XTM3_UNCSA|nr:MAG: cation transporter [candidate division WOR-1 bacterium DG_54_3]
MINKIIEYSLRNKFLIIALFILIIGWGYWALDNTPIDAIPDIGENQQIVFVDWPGRSPKDIEDQVIYPLSVNLMGIPGMKVVRSNSMFSFGMINVIFKEGVDFYWARTRILERLNLAQKDLPEGVIPQLGPDATALGQIFWYTVENGYYCPDHPKQRYQEPRKCPEDGKELVLSSYNLGELRSLQDWYIQYQLNSAEGVSEVATVGGFVKQYQIDVDPHKLLAFNVSLHHMFDAVRSSNIDVGAKVIEEGGAEFIVRGLGFIKSIDDIENIVIGSHEGVPVYIKNVGEVTVGPDFRRGALDKEGAEVTGGVVLMRYAENPLKVIEAVKAKIEEITPGLPAGVQVVSFYDRTELINRATDNLKKTLLEEIIVAVIIILLFLAHFRSSLIVSIILPVGVLISFLIMFYLKIPSNIMSLGGIAIAIGVMVDAGIVMTENISRHLASSRKKELSTVIMASKEVGSAIFFAILIIVVAFIPVFSLRGQSGKLFSPLAFTKTFAMFASAILAITLIPVLSALFLRGKIRPPEKNLLTRILNRLYEPVLRFSLKHKITVVLIALILLGASYFPLSKIKSEFMPPLDEGDLLFMPVLLPGASLTQVMDIMKKQDMILKAFPEVENVVGKLGRAETPTDPAPVGMIETIVKLKPKKLWRKGMTRQELINEMDNALKIPGVSNIWTQPIRNRIDMLATGIQTPIGVKVFGEDLKKIEEIGIQIESILREIPGSRNPYAERIGNKPYIEIDINRQEAARYGVKVGDIQHLIMTAIGGMNITTTVEGRERYPVRIRYMRELRDSFEALERIFVPTPAGAQIPLSQLAAIKKVEGPAKIAGENTLPYVRVFVDVNTDEVGVVDFVDQAQKIVRERLDLPSGYYISWSGQYEYEMQARKRLMMVVPICIFIIFLLLYIKFKRFSEALILIFSLPFAFVGGIWLQYILGFKFSTAVWVGYIALFGVAVEDGVVMMDFLAAHVRKGINNSESILKAALLRVRPIVMTTATTILALIPILISTGSGAEIMKPIATPTVGGMVTATVLNLIIVPVIFAWVLKVRLRKEGGGEE